MAARNYDDSLVATDSIYEPGANGFPDGSEEYLLFRDPFDYLQKKGIMPGSLQKFMTAVENGNTGFIEWKSIDEKWTSYEVALKSVVNQVFYGPKATDTELKTFYDKVDRINQARQEAPTGHDGVKQIWKGLWDQLHKNFSYLNDNEEDAAEDEGEDGRDGNGDSD